MIWFNSKKYYYLIGSIESRNTTNMCLCSKILCKNLCEKKCFRFTSFSDSSTGNGVIGTMQYIANQQEVVACYLISELKAI